MNSEFKIPPNFTIKIDPKLSKIGLTEKRCPYCKSNLDAFPSTKKKCPHCKEEMIVRKRPLDNTPALFTKNQLIDLEKELLAKTASNRLKIFDIDDNYKRYFEIRHNLKEQFGFEPKNNDIIWRLFDENTNKYSRSGKRIPSGLYLLHMGNFLEAEQKFSHAFKYYLQVCYLDSTMGGISHTSEDSLKNKTVNIQNIRPAVFEYMLRMKKVYSISSSEFEEQFISTNAIIFEQYEGEGLKCTPKEAWPIIMGALQEHKII